MRAGPFGPERLSAKAAQAIARLFVFEVFACLWGSVADAAFGILHTRWPIAFVFLNAADELAVNPTWSVSHE